MMKRFVETMGSRGAAIWAACTATWAVVALGFLFMVVFAAAQQKPAPTVKNWTWQDGVWRDAAIYGHVHQRWLEETADYSLMLIDADHSCYLIFRWNAGQRSVVSTPCPTPEKP